MFTIDTDELFDYLSCPLKLSYPRQERVLNSYQNVKSKIFNQLFDYCLILRISDITPTIYKLNERLNSIWASIKSDILCNTNLSLKLGIKNKLSTFLSFFKEVTRVVYFNIPRTIQISDTSVLYTFSSVYHKSELKTIVKLNNQFISMGEGSSPIELVGSLIKDSLNRLGDDLSHDLSFFRSDTGDLIKVAYNQSYKVSINNLIKGLESKIFYPRNEYLNCISCQYNKSCTWSYV